MRILSPCSWVCSSTRPRRLCIPIPDSCFYNADTGEVVPVLFWLLTPDS